MRIALSLQKMFTAIAALPLLLLPAAVSMATSPVYDPGYRAGWSILANPEARDISVEKDGWETVFTIRPKAILVTDQDIVD